MSIRYTLTPAAGYIIVSVQKDIVLKNFQVLKVISVSDSEPLYRIDDLLIAYKDDFSQSRLDAAGEFLIQRERVLATLSESVDK